MQTTRLISLSQFFRMCSSSAAVECLYNQNDEIKALPYGMCINISSEVHGSPKWLSWVSEIMEIPISHKNFPLKPHKGPKRIFLTEQVVVTETRYCYSNRRKKTFFLWQKQIFCHRKEIMSQKKCLSDKNSAREKFPSVYKFSSEKIFFCLSFCRRNIFR